MKDVPDQGHAKSPRFSTGDRKVAGCYSPDPESGRGLLLKVFVGGKIEKLFTEWNKLRERPGIYIRKIGYGATREREGMMW